MFFPSFVHKQCINISKQAFRKISTIYALSSGFNRSAVAVIRISGPKSHMVLEKMANLRPETVKPRFAYLRQLKHPVEQDILDKGLVFWFPGPRSYTGEDSVELHVHGGTAVISALLNALQCLPEFRMAEPGEFTKRAFLAGKLDVTEVEGLADLLRAETEAQRKQAIRQANGELALLYAKWRSTIIEGMAHLEAFIDFGEDQDIGSSAVDFVCNTVSRLQVEITKFLNDNRRGERLRNGVHVAIVGEPNVGKSSLLNLLSQKQAAIVSPYAGTTRDVLEISLDIGGYPLILCDTAGLRPTHDPVELEGLARARDRAGQADLVILVLDAMSFNDLSSLSHKSEIVRRKLQDLGIDYRDDVKYHILVNKVDLVSLRNSFRANDTVDFVSCKTQQGLERFLQNLTSHLASLCANPSSEAPCITHSRHRLHLSESLENLQNFSRYVKIDLALAAEQLRSAAKSLGKISGRVHTEEILDVLFHSFCIGK